MKKFYYLVATTAVVVVTISLLEVSRSEASAVVEELQKSNLKILREEPFYIETNCYTGIGSGDPRDPIFHRFGPLNVDAYGNRIPGYCYVGYTNSPLPSYYIPCFLVPRNWE